MNSVFFRDNVGLVIINSEGRLFWGARADPATAWQFPQGGLEPGETPRMAMYRELKEEVGLSEKSVVYLAESRYWLKYRFPKPLPGPGGRMVDGQRQKWFLLRFIGKDEEIDLNETQTPEFRDWRWVDYEYPVDHVVEFKRSVYKKVLREFSEHLC